MRLLLYHFNRLTANREYWYASEYLSIVALWREMYTIRFASIEYNIYYNLKRNCHNIKAFSL